jgi:hypothetical protein
MTMGSCRAVSRIRAQRARERARVQASGVPRRTMMTRELSVVRRLRPSAGPTSG